MAQRILMIALIIVIVIGGGFYAYRELVPPPVQEAQGPVYSTKPATRGDITVGIDVTGPLNPSRGGGIQAPGGRNYYEMPTSNISFQQKLYYRTDDNFCIFIFKIITVQ
jgi:HlyD family secretion protein